MIVYCFIDKRYSAFLVFFTEFLLIIRFISRSYHNQVIERDKVFNERYLQILIMERCNLLSWNTNIPILILQLKFALYKQIFIFMSSYLNGIICLAVIF